ncbi:hypothetical protein [Treponema sp.]|uniref:hypothetical protein n=1 Tax=Treponema sp. TaxID=166 RepID=UPI003FA237C2
MTEEIKKAFTTFDAALKHEKAVIRETLEKIGYRAFFIELMPSSKHFMIEAEPIGDEEQNYQE